MICFLGCFQSGDTAYSFLEWSKHIVITRSLTVLRIIKCYLKIFGKLSFANLALFSWAVWQKTFRIGRLFLRYICYNSSRNWQKYVTLIVIGWSYINNGINLCHSNSMFMNCLISRRIISTDCTPSWEKDLIILRCTTAGFFVC